MHNQLGKENRLIWKIVTSISILGCLWPRHPRRLLRGSGCVLCRSYSSLNSVFSDSRVETNVENKVVMVNACCVKTSHLSAEAGPGLGGNVRP